MCLSPKINKPKVYGFLKKNILSNVVDKNGCIHKYRLYSFTCITHKEQILHYYDHTGG